MTRTLADSKLPRLMAILALALLVTLMIPGLAWADHASVSSEDQYEAASGLSTDEFRQWLTQQFIDGGLVRYSPGR